MIHDNLYAYFYICIYVHVHVHVYVYLYCLYVCLFGKLSLTRATSGEILVEAPSVTDTTPPPPQPTNHTTT